MKIKLTPTPELESRGIVAEEKSPDSREIVAEPAPVVVEETIDSMGRQPRGKTNPRQLEAAKKWNNKQAQIAIRVKPHIKAQFDEHCKNRRESLAAFLVRAGLNQIKLDTAAKSIDLDKMLSE